MRCEDWYPGFYVLSLDNQAYEKHYPYKYKKATIASGSGTSASDYFIDLRLIIVNRKSPCTICRLHEYLLFIW